MGDRIGDTTLTMIFEYRETDESFLGWQFPATQFSFEYLYYGQVYDGEAFAAACPDPDFLAGLGRTPECGAYLASINADAAMVHPAVEPLDAGVTRINDVTAADGVVLQDGENRFDRTTRLFSLFADASASVGVDASSVGSTVLSAVDETMLEVVSPLLYAAPGVPLGESAVTAPVPLPGLGGFEPWLTTAGFATIADQGEVQLGSVTAQFYDIEWTQSGAVMRLTGRAQGDKVVEAGTSERIYVIDHPDGLPLIVFVAPGPGGQDQANATVESVLDGIALRTSPVYP
ncbi:MAG: hypothetical protein HKP18_05435 [Acidimicrobiia bacterium]|nr:hypothetical protein [Acidimicrobiia bacterium]